MFYIKRGEAFYVKSADRFVGREQVKVITWSSEKTHAFVFAEKMQAIAANSKLGYSDTEIVEAN